MDKEQLSTFFSIALGIITPFIASPIIYLWYFNESDLGLIILVPLIAILLPSIAFLTAINLQSGWKWALFGNLLFPALTAIFSLLAIGNKVLIDSPTVVLYAQFYNEEGFDLWLRENKTVKCREMDMLSSKDKYGTYKIKKDTLFLHGLNIEYGLSEVNDTLYFVEDRLVFRLDKEWRGVTESHMFISTNRLE